MYAKVCERERKYRHNMMLHFAHNVLLHHRQGGREAGRQATIQKRMFKFGRDNNRKREWCEEKLPSVKNAFMPNAPIEKFDVPGQDTLITSISQINGAKVDGNPKNSRHELFIPRTVAICCIYHDIIL